MEGGAFSKPYLIMCLRDTTTCNSRAKAQGDDFCTEHDFDPPGIIFDFYPRLPHIKITQPRPQAPPSFSMLDAEKWESLVCEIM